MSESLESIFTVYGVEIVTAGWRVVIQFQPSLAGPLSNRPQIINSLDQTK